MIDIATVYKIVDRVLEEIGLAQKNSCKLLLWDNDVSDTSCHKSLLKRFPVGETYSVWEPEGTIAEYPFSRIKRLKPTEYNSFLYRADEIILPSCSLSMLAKIAIGIADTPISKMVQMAIITGKKVKLYLDKEIVNPSAYASQIAGYKARVRSFGVEICESETLSKRFISQALPVKTGDKILLGATYMKSTDETCIVVTSDMVVTPLAKDIARGRNINLEYIKE